MALLRSDTSAKSIFVKQVGWPLPLPNLFTEVLRAGVWSGVETPDGDLPGMPLADFLQALRLPSGLPPRRRAASGTCAAAFCTVCMRVQHARYFALLH